uniref:Iron hydrogenase large subunit C-terminal domain-containing protein n=1 Tax=Pinguiococcus pyrenoidosus TaxID=172671 RepID=A0A7R9U8M7_9STRA|mmetsp:Transcript_19252/g.72713  ORF Transcript_19252/g.72713 Transcript_19252/m.72713 type:complete len:504 (+) Transcript_19252:262-1773(+)
MRNGGADGRNAVASPNFAAGQVAKVQLSDCLACSGCLTSAETVLFQQQTSSTLKALEQAPETPKVVSLSSASRAALANFFGVPPADAGVGLLKVLEELGSFRILDAGLAHSLVLDEALEEFLGRYQEQRQKGERRRKRGRHAVEWRKNAAEAPVTEAGLPLLASECPGWVLYVEKSAPEALPYISRVKSSMRVSGWIAKAGLEANATETIHISIQPCADKKLEAARKDSLGKEVDVTLTTTELIDYVLDAFEAKKSSSEQLARLDAGDWFRGCIESALGGVTQEQLSLLATSFRADDTPKENRSRQLVWTGLPVPDSAGSGGYAEFVFRGAARRLFDIELPEDQLPWEQARNSDSHVLVLNADGSVGGVGDTEEEPLLVFARAYGFRNIQGLLGNFRRGHAKHDYVEVMACPSGCSNGGGHPRNVLETAPQNGDEPASTPASVAKLAADVERLQHQREQGKIDTVDVKKRISESGRTTRRDFLYTSYQAVPKLQSMSSSGLKW